MSSIRKSRGRLLELYNQSNLFAIQIRRRKISKAVRKVHLFFNRVSTFAQIHFKNKTIDGRPCLAWSFSPICISLVAPARSPAESSIATIEEGRLFPASPNFCRWRSSRQWHLSEVTTSPCQLMPQINLESCLSADRCRSWYYYTLN